MLKINITAENVSINLHSAGAAVELNGAAECALQDAQALEWSKTLCKGERVDYAAAEKAVAELGDGWRLPTRKELESLIDITRHDPAIDTDKYPDTKSNGYWTSSPCAWNEAARWVVSFGLGHVNDRHQGNLACVRAVRASQ